MPLHGLRTERQGLQGREVAGTVRLRRRLPMQKRVRAAQLVAVLGLTGCEQKPSATYTPYAGTLAMSRDDAFLYAVDSDNGIVAVVDTATRAKVAEVKVGLRPERIAVGPDDTLYVSNGGSR